MGPRKLTLEEIPNWNILFRISSPRSERLNMIHEYLLKKKIYCTIPWARITNSWTRSIIVSRKCAFSSSNNCKIESKYVALLPVKDNVNNDNRFSVIYHKQFNKPGKYVECLSTSENANVRQLSDSDFKSRFKFSENLFRMLGFRLEQTSNSCRTGIVSIIQMIKFETNESLHQ